MSKNVYQITRSISSFLVATGVTTPLATPLATLITLPILTVASCFFFPSHSQASDLIVSASASLKDAFIEIKNEFEKENPQHKLLYNFAAGGLLRIQIEQGAPVDVFASAAVSDLELLKKKSAIVENSIVRFASNKLVAIVPLSQKENCKTLDDLKKSTVKRIAVGNPNTVPAGKYTEESLAHFAILTALKPKFVFGENVRQVLDYTERNEVDAAFVFATDAMQSKTVKTAFVLDSRSHSPIIYSAGIVARTKKNELAKTFVSFLTHRGKYILTKYGFE